MELSKKGRLCRKSRFIIKSEAKGIQPTAFDQYLFIEYMARRNSWAAPHFIGSLAQLAEQVAVNHRVTGSIPVGSVWMDKTFCNFSFVWVPASAGAFLLSNFEV